MANEFPSDDKQFQETFIAEVRKSSHGWEVEQDTGWSLMIDAGSPVEPTSGASLRLYGRGIGSPIRGIFIDGRKVFYRTEEEDARHHDERAYGVDAADYVRCWDLKGRVWSIEMGGLGPGYEQALQIAMVEVLRHLVATKPDGSEWFENRDAWRAQIDGMREPMMPVLEPLGLSGAQWGAACSLAGRIYVKGPIEILKAADRRIQVSRHFPTLDPVILAVVREHANTRA